MLEIALERLEKSYEKQKIDQILNDLGWFAAGAGFGFISGNYTGIKIGITISIP
jgi:hypothetical protein